MRRRDVTSALRQMAKESGTEFWLVRNGAKHDVYRLGELVITMPRHVEINELTARGILKDAAKYLKEGT